MLWCVCVSVSPGKLSSGNIICSHFHSSISSHFYLIKSNTLIYSGCNWVKFSFLLYFALYCFTRKYIKWFCRFCLAFWTERTNRHWKHGERARDQEENYFLTPFVAGTNFIRALRSIPAPGGNCHCHSQSADS